MIIVLDNHRKLYFIISNPYLRLVSAQFAAILLSYNCTTPPPTPTPTLTPTSTAQQQLLLVVLDFLNFYFSFFQVENLHMN